MLGRAHAGTGPRDPGAPRRSTRRSFLKTLGRGAGAATVLGGLLPRGADASPAPRLPAAAVRAPAAEATAARTTVALLATEVRKLAHAQHFIDRLLEGYGFGGKHHRPPLELVSLYVDQTPAGDLSRDRAARHRVPIYPTIA